MFNAIPFLLNPIYHRQPSLRDPPREAKILLPKDTRMPPSSTTGQLSDLPTRKLPVIKFYLRLHLRIIASVAPISYRQV
jgi:hypothetical protein